MTEAVKVLRRIEKVVPCGMTTGHGESCTEGWLCIKCGLLLRAHEAISDLLRERKYPY